MNAPSRPQYSILRRAHSSSPGGRRSSNASSRNASRSARARGVADVQPLQRDPIVHVGPVLRAPCAARRAARRAATTAALTRRPRAAGTPRARARRGCRRPGGISSCRAATTAASAMNAAGRAHDHVLGIGKADRGVGGSSARNSTTSRSSWVNCRAAPRGQAAPGKHRDRADAAVDGRGGRQQRGVRRTEPEAVGQTEHAAARLAEEHRQARRHARCRRRRRGADPSNRRASSGGSSTEKPNPDDALTEARRPTSSTANRSAK